MKKICTNLARLVALSVVVVLAVPGAVSTTHADDQFDPTVDYRSLKEEFAAEDAGASFGDKRLSIRMPDGTAKRRQPIRRRNFSASARTRN